MPAYTEPGKPQQDGNAPPVSIRPQYAVDWTARSCDVQQCCEDAFTADTPSQQVAAVISGCGQDAADAAAAARNNLANALATNQQPLGPDDLVAAFEQCHVQLLQQSAAQQRHQQQQHPLNITHSGASALLVCLDRASKQLMAASVGLCHAVMARTAPDGAFTVLELSPRLALGFNVAETSRLDAFGSSICYGAFTADSCTGTDGGTQPVTSSAAGSQATAADNTQQQQQQQQHAASCVEPVLVGPGGQALPGVRASRLLGYSSASSAGVIPTPLVTTWRLFGGEAFVVLGSPGLWVAMNPAEVVDYIAAALSSGACSMPAAGSANILPNQQQEEQEEAAAAAAQLRPDAAVLLSDLLTLEAQERLKLRLADVGSFLGLGAAGAADGSTGLHQIVPDVSATVLLLQQAPLPLQKAPVDPQLLKEQLSGVSRGCRSNAEAQALQASWYSTASACSSTASMTAISSSTNSSSSSAPASMSSSADSSCSTATSHGLLPAAAVTTSSSSDALAVSGRSHPKSCPSQSPPCPALSCLLPALSVGGHCWPSTFWPSATAVRVPAGISGLKGALSAAAAATASAAGEVPSGVSAAERSSSINTDNPAAPCSPEALDADAPSAFDGTRSDAAAAADAAAAGSSSSTLDRRSSSSGGPIGLTCSSSGATSRPVAFALSQRLSIELDVTHRAGSSGGMSALAAQCAAADAAADAAAGSSRQLDALPSPCTSEDQAVIVHKVRLSGPNELESLLYGSATTAYPDTTVARILKPRAVQNGALAHAYSWAAGGLGCYNSTSASSGTRQQQRVHNWSMGGWTMAGAQHTAHHTPRRSASVNIAALSRQLHSGVGGSCSSSSASSQSQGSLRAAGSSGCQPGLAGSHAGAARDTAWGPRNSLDTALPPLASKVPAAPSSGAAGIAAAAFAQQQQMQWSAFRGASSSSGGGFQQASKLQAYSMPATIQATGRVSKARSYQALSALQAAGSAELSNSLATAAGGASAAAAAGMPAAPPAFPFAASADAASILAGNRNSSSSCTVGVGLYPHAAQQMHFRPAFRSAVHSADVGAPFMLRQRCSDSAVPRTVQYQQQQRPAQRLSACDYADSACQQLGSAGAVMQAQSSIADSRASLECCSQQELPEGKVRGGLARSRSSSLKTLSAAEVLAITAATPAPGASIPTAQHLAGDDSSSSGSGSQSSSLTSQSDAGLADELAQGTTDCDPQQQQQGVPEPADATLAAEHSSRRSGLSPGVVNEPSEQCVRGGHTKAARLRHSLSSPELMTMGRGRTAVGGMQTQQGMQHMRTQPMQAAGALVQQQQKQKQRNTTGGARAGGSLPQGLQDNSSLGVSAEGGGDSMSGAIPFANDISARSPSLSCMLAYMQQHQQQAGVSAFAGASALSPASSRELPEGSAGADGAVHGGELGEQALEGQVHGGRRSKSMSVNSLLLTSSLPSSAEDDNTLTSSLSPNSMQQQQNLRHSAGVLRSANSCGSVLSCSSGSGWRQPTISPAGSGALQLPARPCSVSAAGAAVGSGMQAAGLPGSESSNTDICRTATNSSSGAGSGSIEVLRMPSGSFTRVRFAASAPAGAPGEQLPTVASSDSPVNLQGPAQYSPAGAGLAAMLGDCSSGAAGALQATGTAPVSSSSSNHNAAWGTANVRGWSSPNRHVVSFSSSAGSSDAAVRSTNDSSSMPSQLTGLSGNNPLPPGPRPAWSTSRAWGGSGKGARKSNMFARPSGDWAASAAPASSSTSATVEDAKLSSSQVSGAGAGLSHAAAATSELGSMFDGTKSAPLPTLQESPAHTPGTSPAVAFGFVAAYEETLARHLGAAAALKNHHQQQQQGLGPTSDALSAEDADDRLMASSAVPSSLTGPYAAQQCQQQQQHLVQHGSFAEHSATGLVVQSLSAEASRRSTEDSGCGGGGGGGTSSRSVTSGSSDKMLSAVDDSVGVRQHCDAFEFSKPAGGDAVLEQSPLLGKILQG